MSLSDTELISAIVTNDEKAFKELFERHWEPVYAVAFKYTKDEDTSLEIAHDIFLNIWHKRHQLNIKSFRSYVITAASYHGIRKIQNMKAIPIDYVEDIATHQMSGKGEQVSLNSGEMHIDKTDLEQKVDILLNTLPKRCREIYIMSRQENLSIPEIAERFNISKRTVENQLTTALKHLRKAIEYLIIIAFLNSV